MIKTLRDLQTLIKSPDYMAIALGNQESGWQGSLNSPSDVAARLHAWESLQAIAVLFETYGEAMQRVELNVEIQRDEDEHSFAEAWLQINGHDCMRVDDIGDFDSDLQDQMDDIDNMEALEECVDRILTLPNHAIIRHFEVFENATKGTLTSAEQARERAAAVAAPFAWRIHSILVDRAGAQQAAAIAKPSSP